MVPNSLNTNTNVGISNNVPLLRLHIKTPAMNDGIMVEQTGNTIAALNLQANTGRRWALFSTGTGNAEGAGNFAIYDYSSARHRMFINGVSGYIGIGTNTPINAQLEVKHVNPQSGWLRAIYANAYPAVGNPLTWNAGAEGVGGDNCFGSNFGIRGRAYNGKAYGGFFIGSILNCSNPGAVGIGVFSTGTHYAGYFNGNVHYTGWLTGPSDRNLKDNIQPMADMLSRIRQLKPSTFTFRTGEFKDMGLPEGQQLGLIAQDLQRIFPELVRNISGISSANESGGEAVNTPDHLAVNYTSLISVLIAGMQEQQQQIDELKAMVQALTGKTVTANPASSISLSDKNVVVLNQNTPNPFAESTLINYQLPAEVSKAQILISNLSGKLLKTIAINQKGSGFVRVFASDLSSGVYQYSLVADGKILETRQMVKQ